MINWNKYLNLSSPKNINLILWFSGACLLLGFFLKLTSELITANNFHSVDVPILQYIALHIRSPELNGTAVDITALGSPSILGLTTIIALASLLIKKDKMGALFLGLNVIGATLWMSLLKNVIARERPNIIPRLIEVDGMSYPSGHSLVSTATYLAIAFLVCRHIHSKKLISLVLSFTVSVVMLIAFSRLYLGVHYPSDVVSGIFFGASWVLWLTAFFKTFSKKEILPN